jgi:transcriptional regulator with XRE-family HTH domain
MAKLKASRLWLARKRIGQEQKQIAKLIACPIEQISRYETEQRLPSLKTALKFSILYKLPIRTLFAAYYEECRKEVTRRAESSKGLKLDLDEPTDYCSYIEIMKASFMSEADKTRIRKHALELINERRTKILGH